MITCCSCQGEYEEILGTLDQAHGCASESGIFGIYCYYGSKYDCEFFKPVSDVEHGIMCDNCIEDYLSSNVITSASYPETTSSEITLTYSQILDIKDFAYKIAQLPNEILVLKQTNTGLTISMTKKL
jgi:hypothetical protein